MPEAQAWPGKWMTEQSKSIAEAASVDEGPGFDKNSDSAHPVMPQAGHGAAGSQTGGLLWCGAELGWAGIE